MSLYSISIFLHIVGAVGIFASVGIEQAGLRGLRRARTGAQVHEWVGALRGLQRVQGPSALLILVTGIYMGVVRWGHQAWIMWSLLGMVAMAVLGMALTGRRVRTIARAIPAVDGAIPSALQRHLHDDVLRISGALRAALALWIVFNMSVKPGSLGALVALGVALAVGLTVGSSSGHKTAPVPRHATES